MATPSNFDAQPMAITSRPPAMPPRFLKRQIYSEPRVFKAIDDHAVNEARTNYRNFRDLIYNLIFKKNFNDLEKARVIFRWMTTKNMYTIMFDSELPGSPEAVLGGFKDGKTTYARIFECLASFAGLHCITLSGWAKGVDYRPGMPITSGPINHSWNAVHLDGNWQLVDSHWATRYLQSERNTPENLVYEYDDFYFVPEPNQLVYSHCPEDPAWQLCYPARSRAEYEDYPLVKSYFFTVGMKFLQQDQGVIYTHKGILVLTLGSTKPAAFTFKLVYGDNGYENIQGVPLKRYVIQETTETRVSFYLRAPREGNYYLTVFAQQVQERLRLENIYKAVCEYKVICDQAAPEIKPFPMCSDSNWGPGAPVKQYGLTPSQDNAILPAPNGRAEVVFTKTRPCRLYARLTKDGMMDNQLENAVSVREQDDKVYVTCNLPRPGEYGLEVYGNEPAREGDTFTHICQYLATYSDSNPRALYGQVYDRDDVAYGNNSEPIPYNYAPEQYAAGPGDLQRAGPPGQKQGQDYYSPDRYGDDPMRSEYYGGGAPGSLGRGPGGSKVPPGTAAKPGQGGAGPYSEDQRYQARDGAPGYDHLNSPKNPEYSPYGPYSSLNRPRGSPNNSAYGPDGYGPDGYDREGFPAPPSDSGYGPYGSLNRSNPKSPSERSYNPYEDPNQSQGDGDRKGVEVVYVPGESPMKPGPKPATKPRPGEGGRDGNRPPIEIVYVPGGKKGPGDPAGRTQGAQDDRGRYAPGSGPADGGRYGAPGSGTVGPDDKGRLYGAPGSGPDDKGRYGAPGSGGPDDRGRYGAPGSGGPDDKGRYGAPGSGGPDDKGRYGAPGSGGPDDKGRYGGPGSGGPDDRGRYGGPGSGGPDDRGRYGGPGSGGPGQDDRGRYAGPGSDGRDQYPGGAAYPGKEDPLSTLERRAQPLPSFTDQMDKQNQKNLGAAYGGAYPFGKEGRAGVGPDSYRQRPTEPELEYKPHDPKMYTSTITIQPPTSFKPEPVMRQEEAPQPAPPAVPPKPFKDTSIFTNVDLHAVEVSKEEHKSFRELVWHLIYARNITNELEKARAIFLWLCSKDLAQISFDNAPKGSPEEILMNLQKGQTTYAVVYETLCSYAGLHCKTISGYAKGAEYKPGMKFTGEQGQHSWNAVLVEGAWRLVDCHWAARRLVGKKVTPENVRYELDEYYFMPDPHQLIFTHYPDDQSWQLLDRPISLADFENLVPVKSAFFKYGLQILSHREAVIVTNREVTIRVGCPPFKAEQLAFTFTLAYDDGKEEFRGTKLNRYGMQEMLDNVSYFTIRPPEKGAYRLILYAKDLTTQTKEGVYGGICEYEVKMESNPAKPTPFPPCVHTSWGPGDSVHKYDLQALQKGAIFSTVNGQAEVKFKLPKELRFTAKLKNKDLEEKDLQGYIMHRVVGELAVFTFTAPSAGEYGLEIYANDPEKDGNSLYHAFQYLIIAQEVKGPVESLPTLPPGYLGPQPTFKKLGLSTTTHTDPFVQTDSGDLQVAFGMGQPLRMTSQLIYVSQNQNEDYSDYILQQSQGNNVIFMLKLPKVGMYKFQVYALPFSDSSESLPGVYNYLINCRMTHATLVPFPKQYGQWKEGCYLTEPLEGHLQPNRSSKGSASSIQAVFVKVSVPKANSVAVVVGEDWTQLDQKGGAWEGEVLMEKHWGKESKAALCANYGTVKASYSTLLEYTL